MTPTDCFSPGTEPCILKETPAYLLVYKPPGMHSAPLRNRGPSLAGWCAALFPEITEIRGRTAGEGGLLHRLDRETHGLVLLARNQKSYDCLLEQQREGLIQKEYGALAARSSLLLPGFPPPAPVPGASLRGAPLRGTVIESGFRAYGPGRRQVRPLVCSPAPEAARDQGGNYRTEILESSWVGELASGCGVLSLRLRICRGFRHQIRCHLAWTGFPILNDPLSGGAQTPGSRMALYAQALVFFDPMTGEKTEFSIKQPPCSPVPLGV